MPEIKTFTIGDTYPQVLLPSAILGLLSSKGEIFDIQKYWVYYCSPQMQNWLKYHLHLSHLRTYGEIRRYV
jgi:hypothetical protein